MSDFTLQPDNRSVKDPTADWTDERRHSLVVDHAAPDPGQRADDDLVTCSECTTTFDPDDLTDWQAEREKRDAGQREAQERAEDGTACPDKACSALSAAGCRYPGWRMCLHRADRSPEQP